MELDSWCQGEHGVLEARKEAIQTQLTYKFTILFH